ncbi:UDP-galactopyranose mutase [Parasediminibacterium sp. JCM 36343]|uniref:UDP-galactopyranose mutase n=1 Tax=Parasediminibacterium sp. JCM 36343 TaxID=3374279 RepID=UPI00397B85C7
MYDYLIVGSGLFGAVFARQMADAGKKCLVIDKRAHIGGNVYTENIAGINVHKYGAHIFHTNDKPIWDYVNAFVEFNRYTNSPLAMYNGKLYNMPFNMNTFYQMWGVTKPDEVKKIIAKQIKASGITTPQNLEEQAISMVGTDIFKYLIKGYTEKQWGRDCKDLPAFIIKRLPLRFTYDNNYFNDKYQGIPIGGYTKLVEGLLEGIEVRLSQDYFDQRDFFNTCAKRIVYSGKIDEFFNYDEGYLEYRSLRFETTHLEDTNNFQGNAVVNYTNREVPYTRILEHKHFEFGMQPTTVITKEFSQEWDSNNEPYYPINDLKNEQLASNYKKRAAAIPNVIFGGRLAEYRYYDMHQIVAQSLKISKDEISKQWLK